MNRPHSMLLVGTLLLFGAGAALVLSNVRGVSAQDPKSASSDVTIHIRDYCDPVSFDLAVGPGACVRDPLLNGAITFTGFVSELNSDKSAGAWRFAPEQVAIAEGATLHVQNLGGETHTFTEVKKFGGGFVDFLNKASGNPIPAPECAEVMDGQLVPQPAGPDNNFIPAGGSATVKEHQGVVRYQCCIHPWMRLTIMPKNESHTEVK